MLGLVPVAIVGLRSEIATKASGDLDRALKLLLERELAGTPGVLLLERCRLGAVASSTSRSTRATPSPCTRAPTSSRAH